MKDEDKKNKVLAEYESSITCRVNSSQAIFQKAGQICGGTKIRQKGALELASAEEGESDVFLTTDDRLIRMGTKSDLVHIRIINPIDFLSELARNERAEQDEEQKR